MKKTTKFKLKVGDKVWVRIPVNALITKVTKWGYTIAPFGEEHSHFDDEDVVKLKK